MLKYEFSKDGVRLAARDLVNMLNGNARLIREYERILQVLILASQQTRSRVKKKKYKSAHDILSEQKMKKVGENQYLFTWYLPNYATVAQNRAKVIQGREMLKRYGLGK